MLDGADVPSPDDLILLHGGAHNAALLHSGAVLRDVGRNSTGVVREARRQTAQENANFALALRILDEDSKAPPMRPRDRAPGPTVEALLREERRRHAADMRFRAAPGDLLTHACLAAGLQHASASVMSSLTLCLRDGIMHGGITMQMTSFSCTASLAPSCRFQQGEHGQEPTPRMLTPSIASQTRKRRPPATYCSTFLFRPGRRRQLTSTRSSMMSFYFTANRARSCTSLFRALRPERNAAGRGPG